MSLSDDLDYLHGMLSGLYDAMSAEEEEEEKEGPSDSEKLRAFETLLMGIVTGVNEEDIMTLIRDMIDDGYFSDELLAAFVCYMRDGDSSDATCDDVEHPDHYTFGPVECFEMIRAIEGDERAAGFAIGSCWKYMYRHNRKGQDIKDLGKVAQFAKMYREVEADILAAKEANKVQVTSTCTEGMVSSHPRRYWVLSCGHSFLTPRDLGIPKTCPICSREIDDKSEILKTYQSEE